MSERKMALLQELDEARVYLNAALESIDTETLIYPGWYKREMIAHIAGWESMCYEAFRAFMTGGTLQKYPFENNVDAANSYFVGVREKLPLRDATTEYEINRFVIRQFLKDIPEAEYDTPLTFVWWQETPEQFVHGAVKHERDHADDIRAASRRTEKH